MISWSTIEAECDNYRDGFVAVFRKYQGEPTDERDAQGRVVKVTQSSFARHVGIPETTFKRWVSVAQGKRSERGPDAHAGAARRFADKLPTPEKAKLVDDLLADPAVREHRLTQLGEDRSPASRKAAEAYTAEAVKNVRNDMQLAIQATLEAAEYLREAIEHDSVTPRNAAEQEKAFNTLSITMAEMRLGVSV